MRFPAAQLDRQGLDGIETHDGAPDVKTITVDHRDEEISDIKSLLYI